MAKSVQYGKIKSLFESVEEIEIVQRKNGRFRFPIYMTETLAKTDIEALELSVRSLHCLKRAEISTIGEFCDRIHSSNDLKIIKNCGKTSISEIMDNLFAYQYLALKPDKRGEYLAKVVEMNVSGMEKNI